MVLTHQKKLVIGTAQLGLNYGINNKQGKPSLEQAQAILKLAREAGIKRVDTAEDYGDSYDILQHFHKNISDKSCFKIFTKFTVPPKDLKSYLDKTTKHLGIEKLHGISFHDIQHLKSTFHKLDFKSAKEEGLLQYVGVSVYSKNELEQILEMEDINLVQLPLNLLDNRSQYGNILAELKDRSIRIQARSCYLQGFLTMEKEDIPNKLMPLLSYRDQLEQMAREEGISLAQMAFLYPLSLAEVDELVFGVETANQLNQNLAFTNKILSENLVHQINTLQVKESFLLKPYNW